MESTTGGHLARNLIQLINNSGIRDIPRLKEFNIIILIFCFFCLPGKVSGDYLVGMAINPSSNMLLRPDGKSGTIAYLYGKADFSAGESDFSYEINSGMIERYKGLQFQRHSLNISHLLLSKKIFTCNTVLDGIFSKYD